MDERLKHIVDNFETMKIGLDDKFKFNCTMCGNCCFHREDILLTPKDVFKMSKALKMNTLDFINKYCEVYIGQSSRIPIVRILPVGQMKRCPLLKGKKCSVHDVKPTVCAMFPIGRCLMLDDDSKRDGNFTVKDIQYIFTNPNCGNKKKEHTVRDWLRDFDMSTEDEYFIKWHQTVAFLSRFIRDNESKMAESTLEELENVIYIVLYLSYDFEKDFFPQFCHNADLLVSKIKNLKMGGTK